MFTALALLRTFLVGGLLAGAGLGLIGLLDTAPQVAPPPPPRAEDARFANVLLRDIQRIRDVPGAMGELSATLDEINGLMRLLGRAHPEIAGQARIADARLILDVSMPLPRSGGSGWLNLSATVPPFEDGFALEAVRVGGIPLPAGAAEMALLWALDRRLGEGTGARVLAALTRLRIEGEAVRVGVDLGALPRGNLSRLTLGGVYGRPMPSHAEVAAYVAAFMAAAADGKLPRDGSFLPWLRMLLEIAAARADHDDPERELIAGLAALNHLCGSVHFSALLTPRRTEGEARLPPPGDVCAAATLRGRVDLRRHFLTAATMKAMSDRGPAVVAGEAKELSDMLAGAFDFSDIAANNSGIRLAALMLATPPAEWPALGARMRGEDDVIVPLDGIPGEMPPAAFRLRFGEVDSPAYLAMIAEIEARIDALPIHAAGQGG